MSSNPAKSTPDAPPPSSSTPLSPFGRPIPSAVRAPAPPALIANPPPLPRVASKRNSNPNVATNPNPQMNTGASWAYAQQVAALSQSVPKSPTQQQPTKPTPPTAASSNLSAQLDEADLILSSLMASLDRAEQSKSPQPDTIRKHQQLQASQPAAGAGGQLAPFPGVGKTASPQLHSPVSPLPSSGHLFPQPSASSLTPGGGVTGTRSRSTSAAPRPRAPSSAGAGQATGQNASSRPRAPSSAAPVSPFAPPSASPSGPPSSTNTAGPSAPHGRTRTTSAGTSGGPISPFAKPSGSGSPAPTSQSSGSAGPPTALAAALPLATIPAGGRGSELGEFSPDDLAGAPPTRGDTENNAAIARSNPRSISALSSHSVSPSNSNQIANPPVSALPRPNLPQSSSQSIHHRTPSSSPLRNPASLGSSHSRSPSAANNVAGGGHSRSSSRVAPPGTSKSANTPAPMPLGASKLGSFGSLPLLKAESVSALSEAGAADAEAARANYEALLDEQEEAMAEVWRERGIEVVNIQDTGDGQGDASPLVDLAEGWEMERFPDPRYALFRRALFEMLSDSSGGGAGWEGVMYPLIPGLELVGLVGVGEGEEGVGVGCFGSATEGKFA
ncbi:hypothetical protein M427DRAFT_75379 [Gonapodya prolifera JEL478]|uniref:Uncharacterized protein n=1 Tax=Gonapodya prolifera (strain JEL478) TaxID=1344416 RepID=A0A138ZYZ4_GONPJ|nr:hypothetical protein M427DRAFT_75379 [Gonapodya prolifera JEL478]|eukprot:KXS09495.1 hypothetical protein M427DRAFT_75379 [Gonapodya prolifera JEL478]